MIVPVKEIWLHQWRRLVTVYMKEIWLYMRKEMWLCRWGDMIVYTKVTLLCSWRDGCLTRDSVVHMKRFNCLTEETLLYTWRDLIVYMKKTLLYTWRRFDCSCEWDTFVHMKDIWLLIWDMIKHKIVLIVQTQYN